MRSLKAKCDHTIAATEPVLEKAKDIQKEMDDIIYALNDAIVDARNMKEVVKLLEKE